MVSKPVYLYTLTKYLKDGTVEVYQSDRNKDLRKKAHVGYESVSCAYLNQLQHFKFYDSILTRELIGTLEYDNKGGHPPKPHHEYPYPDMSDLEHQNIANAYWYKHFGIYLVDAIRQYEANSQ